MNSRMTPRLESRSRGSLRSCEFAMSYRPRPGPELRGWKPWQPLSGSDKRPDMVTSVFNGQQPVNAPLTAAASRA